MNEFQMNVITQFDIARSEVFGPIPCYPGIPDAVTLIGVSVTENRIIGRPLKVDTRAGDSINKTGGLDWMLHVQTAREPAEQNLELFTKDGRDYYKSTRNIDAGEELLVWFTKDYAQILGMPEIQSCYSKGDRNYVCHYCNENFHYSYPLLAHIAFGCAARRKVHGLDNTTRTAFHPPVRNGLTYDHRTAEKTIVKDYSIEYLSNNYERSSKKIISFYPLFREDQVKSKDLSNNVVPLHRPYINGNSERKSPFDPEDQKNDVKQRDTILVKRKLESESNFTSNKHAHSVINMVGSPSKTSETNQNSPSPERNSPNSSVEKMDHNQNVQKTSALFDDSNDNGSAFKKVNKLSRPFLDGHPPSIQTISIASQPTFTTPDVMYPAPLKSLFPNMTFNVPLISSSVSTNGIRPTMTPTTTHSMTPSNSSIPSAFMATKLIDPAPVSFIPNYKSLDTLRPTLTPTPDNLENRPFYSSTGFSENRVAMGYPYPKTFGSSLDNFVTKQSPQATTLPPSVITLGFPAQNWCAKCNASFRMTSDLVYHMRSHHKRDPDPNKKKRDDKLKCSVCNETFRERHHLTRHMTSHQ